MSIQFPNSEMAEFETPDLSKNTAFSTICLLTIQVNTPRSPSRFAPFLSGNLTVFPKIQSLTFGIWVSLNGGPFKKGTEIAWTQLAKVAFFCENVRDARPSSRS